MRIFVRLDLGTALSALERSPHPGFIDVVLWLTFAHDDLAAMEDVLRGAPRVFDEQSAWIGRNVVALVALHQIPTRLQNLARSHSQRARLLLLKGVASSELEAACTAAAVDLRTVLRQVAELTDAVFIKQNHAIDQAAMVARAVGIGGPVLPGHTGGPAGDADEH